MERNTEAERLITRGDTWRRTREADGEEEKREDSLHYLAFATFEKIMGYCSFLFVLLKQYVFSVLEKSIDHLRRYPIGGEKNFPI